MSVGGLGAGEKSIAAGWPGRSTPAAHRNPSKYPDKAGLLTFVRSVCCKVESFP